MTGIDGLPNAETRFDFEGPITGRPDLDGILGVLVEKLEDKTFYTGENGEPTTQKSELSQVTFVVDGLEDDLTSEITIGPSEGRLKVIKMLIASKANNGITKEELRQQNAKLLADLRAVYPEHFTGFVFGVADEKLQNLGSTSFYLRHEHTIGPDGP